MRILAVQITLIALLGTTAKAGGIATSIQSQSDSPVRLLACNAGFQNVSNGWGTSYYNLVLSSSFRNTSSKTAVAVLVRFELSDAFGDVLGVQFGQSAGQFSENTDIDGQKWTGIDKWPGLADVRCSIGRVLFDDGTTWKEPTSSASSPPSGTSQ